MAEVLVSGGAAADLTPAGGTGSAAMAYLQEEKPDSDLVPALNLGDLDITTDEFILDEVDIHIQANLEDELVQEALKTGVDLRQMEEMLSGFQSDLSSISSEIQTLQQQSVSMNIRLKNRQAVRSQLSQLVDELVVPSTMISYVPLVLLSFMNSTNKINFAKELSFRETLACSDIQDIVDRLKIKAVSKIREFILYRIKSNYFISNILFFYQFLLANERTVAKEIRDEYVDTMSKIYFCYFKSYSSRLLKVQVRNVLGDLMGVEDTAKKDIHSWLYRNTIFTLGQRGAVLSPRGDSRFPYETLFRSQHYALLDNGCREFLFLSDFFMVAGNSALDLFNSVMGKTLSMFLKNMSAYVSDCYDSIAVFLCIHIILRFKAITAKRNIPALDKYWEVVLEMLWPRFELILEMNIQSIRNTDPQKLGVLDTRPHYIEVENLRAEDGGSEFPSRKDQLIFLINNERAADDSKEVEGFQQLLLARTQEFIEEILAPPFGGMITFVKESEALMEKGQLDKLKNDEGKFPINQ
uniref:Vacuolar protein sorting-associated protein 52 homolog n=1 Tax=Astyanax mexicanus TaxID=7994 RepID=A0A3B1KHL8_ASTMX